MQFSKTPLVFYFGRDKIDLYVAASKQLVSWKLADTVFRDLEVVDAPAFRRYLTDAIAAYKIKPDQVIIILSEQISFAVELPSGEGMFTDREAVLRQFRTQVPFPSPFVKEITKDKKRIAIALNRDLYDLLIDQFKGLEFEVSTLVPSQLLPFTMPASGMTAGEATAIIQHWPKLEAQDFLEAAEKKVAIISSSAAQTPEEKRRTVTLVAVFAVLLLVLGGVTYYMIGQNSKEKAAFQKAQEEAIAALAGTTGGSKKTEAEETEITGDASGEQASAAATIAVLADLEVTVFQPENSTLAVDDVTNVLSTLGALDPEVVENSELSTDGLVVNTGAAVSAAVRQQIRQAFEAEDIEVTVRGVADLDEDVRVILPI